MKAMCLTSVRPDQLDPLSQLNFRIFQVLLAVWLVGASAVIYAVQHFDDEVQMTRFVGDGAVYSCKS